jgi:hypothetical protein
MDFFALFLFTIDSIRNCRPRSISFKTAGVTLKNKHFELLPKKCPIAVNLCKMTGRVPFRVIPATEMAGSKSQPTNKQGKTFIF